MQPERATLYEDVADRLHSLIHDGTLRPGERIPSVRKLHNQWSVSVSTVLEAYRLLEDRGVVEARPKSGYYVRLSPRLLLEEPVTTDPPPRACRVSGSLVYRLMTEVTDPDVLKLGAAMPHPDLLPLRTFSRLMSDAMRRHPEQCHGYAIGPGHQALRREIARRMVDAGCSLAPDDIQVTSGCQEAVFLSLKAVTKPGDAVVVESPSYYGLLETLEALDLRAIEVRTHPREGIDLDALEEVLGSGRVAACVLCPTFSNPLGGLMPDAKKRALVALLASREVPLVEDDIYGDLPFDGPRPRAAKAFDKKGLVLYCSSFSKTISPGARIGWAIAGRFRDEVARLKLVTTVASSGAPQLAIAAFLKDGGYDRHLRRLRRTYREHVARMTALIGRTFPAGTRVTRPAGGHVLWIEMPREVDSLRLYEEASAHRISFAPGTMFSARNRYRHCMRLNCALPWSDRIERAVETLARLARAHLD